MKIIIEKYVCDVCNKEVNVTDRHYMIKFGSSDNWTDEAKIGEDAIQKDLCHECYNTIIQLIGMKPAVQEQTPVNEPRKGLRYARDKETIMELWGRGFSHSAIAEKLSLKQHQVAYVLGRLTREERAELREKYSNQKDDIQEEDNSVKMKIVSDAEGFVTSVE